MSIVLSILQILGIMLLVLFGLLVVAIVFVLFAPAFYQIEGDIKESKWIKARISWLLHLIRGRISYEDDLVYGELWIAWKKLTLSYDLSESKETDNEDKGDKPKKKKSKGSFIDKIKSFVQWIKDNYPKLKRIVTDERNKQAVVHLKDELFYLIKILLPKKSKLNAEFSTGSPDTTGQLCGVIALFPMMYQKDWKLSPDFTAEEAYFKGDFWGKGRVCVFQLIGILLRIMFDKNCRRMYTMINKLKNSKKKKSV